MKLVMISDTHGMHESVVVPDGDVLIYAGDSTTDAGRKSLRDFLTWLESKPHEHKIMIAGNHDWAFEKWPDLARAMVKEVAPSVTYLQDSGYVIGEYLFWGSPITPNFFEWAFNRARGEEIRRHWDMIPDATNVLITHGPCSGILDKTNDNESAGCRDLYEAILRVQPKLHCCGHIHRSYGTAMLHHDNGWKTQMVNASICGEDYKPTRQPVVIEI